MRHKHLILITMLLLWFSAPVFSQDKLGHLKSWDGKPTREVDNKGKVISDFFALPEIRTPLKRLLSPSDYNLVTNIYAVGTPFKLMGDLLATTMCRPHNCSDERAGLAINLKTGVMYVRMQRGTNERWIVSEGTAKDLPKEVRDFIVGEQ